MAMRFTRQFDQMDCGPACIRMVASHYGKEFPLSYLRSLAHLTREGGRHTRCAGGNRRGECHV